MKTVLITGASGYIGQHLCRYFVNKKYNVIGVYNKTYPLNLVDSLDKKYFRVVKLDLSRPIEFWDKSDYIIHCAAYSKKTGHNVMEYVSNILSTYQIAEYGRRINVKLLIHLSTISVHGDIRSVIVDENTDVINPSNYGLSKLLSEQLLLEYKQHFPSISIRLPGVLAYSFSGIWLAQTIKTVMNNLQCQIYNPDSYFNNVVWIDDLSLFIENLFNNNTAYCGAFPIGAQEPMLIHDMVNFIKDVLHSKSDIVVMPSDKISFTISNKIANAFGYQPRKVKDIIETFIKEVC